MACERQMAESTLNIACLGLRTTLLYINGALESSGSPKPRFHEVPPYPTTQQPGGLAILGEFRDS